jgi:hypothetical protein
MTPPLGLVLAGAGWRLILNPERGAAEAHHEDLAPEPDFGQYVSMMPDTGISGDPHIGPIPIGIHLLHIVQLPLSLSFSLSR